MSLNAKTLFERQYGEGKLVYRQELPWVRRQLRPWLRDRFDVTRDVVVELCRSPGPRRLLDFGCGDGRTACALAEAVPGGLGEIIGIDISASRISQAEGLAQGLPPGHPRMRFIEGDESVIPGVRGGGVDIALCIAVFSQVYDVYGLGRRLRESLRPGGHLVAEFSNYAYVRNRLRFLSGRVPTVSPASAELWPEIGWDSGNIHYFSRATSVRFIEQLGFAVEQVRSTGLLANVIRWWPSLLATGFVIVGRRLE